MNQRLTKTAGARAKKYRDVQANIDQRELSEFLAALVGPLLKRGVSPLLFCELAKRAFVEAAAQVSRMRNGRINQSRISALTGIRRSEIRKLLSNVRSTSAVQSPIQAVLGGWISDPLYAHSKGPKNLPIYGSTGSFKQLVKSYATDVPHRAVLEELTRLGAVKLVGEKVALRNRSIFRIKRSEISLLASLLSDGSRVLDERSGNKKRSFSRRLILSAHSLPELELLHSRCASTIASMLEGLRESLEKPLLVPRRMKRMPYSCTVTVLLVEQRSSSADRANAFIKPQIG